MINLKKMKFTALLLIFAFVLGGITMRVFSQDKTDWSKVSFSTCPNILKFLDHNTGKVYVYSEADGRLLATWIVENLGLPLRKM